LTNTSTSVSVQGGVVTRLPTLDRLLPIWIGVAMAGGLFLGRLVPRLGTALSAIQVGGISLPIGIGLVVIMYPVLAKVRYDQLDEITDRIQALITELRPTATTP